MGGRYPKYDNIITIKKCSDVFCVHSLLIPCFLLKAKYRFSLKNFLFLYNMGPTLSTGIRPIILLENKWETDKFSYSAHKNLNLKYGFLKNKTIQCRNFTKNEKIIDVQPLIFLKGQLDYTSLCWNYGKTCLQLYVLYRNIWRGNIEEIVCKFKYEEIFFLPKWRNCMNVNFLVV